MWSGEEMGRRGRRRAGDREEMRGGDIEREK